MCETLRKVGEVKIDREMGSAEQCGGAGHCGALYSLVRSGSLCRLRARPGRALDIAFIEYA